MQIRSVLTASIVTALGTSITLAPATVASAQPPTPSASAPTAIGTGFSLTSATEYERGADLTITGVGATPHQNVSMWERGNLALSVTADADGAWSLTVPGRVTTENSLTYEFRSVLQPSFLTTFTAADGATAPSFAITSSAEYERGEDFTISGKGGTPHQSVSMWENGNQVRTVVARADGTWEFTIPGRSTTEDSLTLEFRALFDRSLTRTFTAADGLVVPTIEITSATAYERGRTFTIAGTTTQSVSSIQVRAGEEIPFAPRVDDDGDWSFTIPTGSPILDEDSFELRFTAGDAELTQTFTARTQAPVADVTVATRTFVRGQKQLIEGTAEPNARVDIRSGSKYLMHVTADTAGRWSYSTGAAINADTFTRTLTSAGTDDVTFTLTGR